MDMKATAGEIAKNFDKFEYERLKRRDRQVYRAGEIPGDLADAIAKGEPPAEAAAFNHEYAVKAGQ